MYMASVTFLVSAMLLMRVLISAALAMSNHLPSGESLLMWILYLLPYGIL
jgi:hypothetical protein